MSNKLRQQTAGRQVPWTIEQIGAGLSHFYNEHGRYPTATEVDNYPYLPSARSIERRFGGMLRVRKELNLKGQHDFRSGTHRSRLATSINKRSHEVEYKVYEYLCKHFGKHFVHREFFYTDDKRTRADFFVYDAHGGFCVDVFYPNNLRNVNGCLNVKLTKYSKSHMRQYPVVFLQMNSEIEQDKLDTVIKNKERKLVEGQYLFAWETFTEWITTKKPLRVGS